MNQMSKLEFIATHALQGLCGYLKPEFAAQKSVEYAKALIAELNKDTQQELEALSEESRKNVAYNNLMKLMNSKIK